MSYALEMVSCDMKYTQSFMTIGLGAQVILRLLPQQFERCNIGITSGKDL
jgi:hypothetical protein